MAEEGENDQRNFDTFLHSSVHNNITIKLKSGEVTLSSLILSLNSPEFDGMFDHSSPVISEKDIDFCGDGRSLSSTGLKTFKRGLHSGVIELNQECFRDVYKMAYLFRIPWISSECLQFISHNSSNGGSTVRNLDFQLLELVGDTTYKSISCIDLPYNFGVEKLQMSIHNNVEIRLKDGKQMLANSVVLAINSPLFNEFFTKRQLSVHQMNDFEEINVRRFITSLYTGNVKLSRNNFREMIKLAHVFKVSWMLAKCDSYIEALINSTDSQDFEGMFSLLEAARFLKSKFKKDCFMKLLTIRLGKAKGVFTVFVTPYINHFKFENLSIDQMDLIIQICKSDATLLLELIRTNIISNGYVLDNISRYFIRNVDLSCTENIKLSDTLKGMHALFSKELQNTTTDDIKMLTKKFKDFKPTVVNNNSQASRNDPALSGNQLEVVKRPGKLATIRPVIRNGSGTTTTTTTTNGRVTTVSELNNGASPIKPVADNSANSSFSSRGDTKPFSNEQNLTARISVERPSSNHVNVKPQGLSNYPKKISDMKPSLSQLNNGASPMKPVADNSANSSFSSRGDMKPFSNEQNETRTSVKWPSSNHVNDKLQKLPNYSKKIRGRIGKHFTDDVKEPDDARESKFYPRSALQQIDLIANFDARKAEPNFLLKKVTANRTEKRPLEPVDRLTRRLLVRSKDRFWGYHRGCLSNYDCENSLFPVSCLEDLIISRAMTSCYMLYEGLSILHQKHLLPASLTVNDLDIIHKITEVNDWAHISPAFSCFYTNLSIFVDQLKLVDIDRFTSEMSSMSLSDQVYGCSDPIEIIDFITARRELTFHESQCIGVKIEIMPIKTECDCKPNHFDIRVSSTTMPDITGRDLHMVIELRKTGRTWRQCTMSWQGRPYVCNGGFMVKWGCHRFKAGSIVRLVLFWNNRTDPYELVKDTNRKRWSNLCQCSRCVDCCLWKRGVRWAKLTTSFDSLMLQLRANNFIVYNVILWLTVIILYFSFSC